MNVQHELFEGDGTIPNNTEFPLLVYKAAFSEKEEFEHALKKNSWNGAWVNGVYNYHHFHSSAHEVLGVLSGRAEVLFGGEEGRKLLLEKGDVAVIPAGVGHKCLQKDADFQVMGAYPDNEEMDMCTGKPEEYEEAISRIKQVPLPSHDPFYGENGPLFEYWKVGE
ncbi:cupin domain-containing protein [Bacillus sp. FSL H8-0547]